MILLAMAMHYYALPKRSMTVAKANNTSFVNTTFPSLIGRHIMTGREFTYRFQLDYDNWPWQQTGFQILPNKSCISKILINNKEFSFHKGATCNPMVFSHWNPYSGPGYIDISSAIHEGINTVVIKSTKAEFGMGPVIFYHNLRLAKWIGLAMTLVCCIALYKFMLQRTGSAIGGYIITAGFLVHLQRFSHYGVMDRAMDMPGHLIYITDIARYMSWPNPYKGWSFYHPPLYYTIEAIILRYANWLGSFDAMTLMQTFSLSCFMLFIVFSALSLHRFIRNRVAYCVALVLLIFYPSGILFSSHIDSHLLYYACYAACLYFMLRWLDSNQHRHLALALVFLGMGIATRSNALILLPLVGMAFLYNIGRGKVSKEVLRSYTIYIALLIVCVGFAMNFGRIIYYHIIETRHEPLLVGNIFRLSRGLLLNNDSLFTILMPNIPKYLSHPFWSVWSDAEGRQHFWNSMLKSSLTGEYIWDKWKVALYMGNLLLAMIVYLIDAYIIHRQALRHRREWVTCMFGLFIPILALLVNRWVYPYACSEDFRYIYPSIACFCGLMGLTLEQHMKDWRPFRTALGIMMCLGFAFLAVYFYL